MTSDVSVSVGIGCLKMDHLIGAEDVIPTSRHVTAMLLLQFINTFVTAIPRLSKYFGN